MTLDEGQSNDTESNIDGIPPVGGNNRNKRFSNCLELPIFLTMVALLLTDNAVSNILLYRTCVHRLLHTKRECRYFLAPDEGTTNNTLEKEVQKYLTFVSTIRTVIESLTPAILSLFAGVWSNIYGRKPLIVWPLLGYTISSMMVVVYSMLDLGPWWFMLTTLPMSFSGGFTIVLIGAYCFISDVTTTEARTLRMAIFGASISAGSVVGLTLSPYLLKAMGNAYLLLTVSALLATAYALSNIVLEESLIGAAEANVVSIFNISHVKEMADECLKGKPNHGRAQIILLALSNSLLLFIVCGIDGLEYGYTREKLHWSLKDYNRYSAVNTFVSFFGAFIILILLQKVLSFSDLMLAILSLFSGIAGYIIKAFAVTPWNMYFAATISIPKGLSTFLIRSFLTKILSPDVVAKVFTLISALDALCPLLAPVLFNSLYAFSISTFPGGIYLLGSGIAGICTIMLGFVQYYRRNVSTTYQILSSNETLTVN